jgi:hypothetical protein
VVAIHNTVNEKAWREVLAFEELHCSSCPNPRLKKFLGRPKDLSPKARFLNIMASAAPTVTARPSVLLRGSAASLARCRRSSPPQHSCGLRGTLRDVTREWSCSISACQLANSMSCTHAFVAAVSFESIRTCRR